MLHMESNCWGKATSLYWVDTSVHRGENTFSITIMYRASVFIVSDSSMLMSLEIGCPEDPQSEQSTTSLFGSFTQCHHMKFKQLISRFIIIYTEQRQLHWGSTHQFQSSDNFPSKLCRSVNWKQLMFNANIYSPCVKEETHSLGCFSKIVLLCTIGNLKMPNLCYQTLQTIAMGSNFLYSKLYENLPYPIWML